MTHSRAGRQLRQPDRYDPANFSSDDATDEDESVSLPDSVTDSTAGSLEDFVVEDGSESEPDEVEHLILLLFDGAPNDVVQAMLEERVDMECLRGALRGHPVVIRQPLENGPGEPPRQT